MRGRGLQDTKGSVFDTLEYYIVESYYIVSHNYIGLLEHILLAIECHSMASVYEIYSLQSLQASISFNKACEAFQSLP